MKTNLFLGRKALLAACVLCFAGVNAEKIADPGGLQWVVMDAETPGAIPYVPGAEGEFIVKMSPWASQVVSIVDNPKKDPFYNQSEKCVQWVKENVNGEGDWGSVAVEMNDPANDYWDLSAWEKISVDVYVEGNTLDQYKIALYDQATGAEVPGGSVEIWDVAGPANEWNRITMDLSSVKQSGNLTADTKVNKIIFFFNGGNQNKMNILVDNVTFMRTTAPSAVKEVEAETVRIYSNPTTDNIRLDGVQGNVSIYTLSGVEVYKTADYAGEDIQLNHLTPGLYVVKAGNVCAKFTKK